MKKLLFKDYDYREFEDGGNNRFLRVVYSDRKEGRQDFFINNVTGGTMTIYKGEKLIVKAKLKRGDFARLKRMGVLESEKYVKQNYTNRCR